LARALDFVAQLKKLPIVVNDGPGAYTGRLSGAFNGEGAALRADGVSPALIRNAAWQAGFGTPPLLLAGDAEPAPPASVQPPLPDVKNRLLYATALESARCFDEQIVTEAADADLGAVLALGYPKWTGGTLSFIETVGLAPFVAECDRLAGLYGERFRPNAALRERADTGRRFHPAA
jgi:3-hydroxyacyl-CoA dehydrogenase/enoyl-CoA hydratase/3-hydroxybutyryl-CoA epimerase